MKGINAFDVMIHNKRNELVRVPNDYMYERAIAKTFEEREAALHKANLKYFNIKQEIDSLGDLKYRLEEAEYIDED